MHVFFVSILIKSYCLYLYLLSLWMIYLLVIVGGGLGCGVWGVGCGYVVSSCLRVRVRPRLGSEPEAVRRSLSYFFLIYVYFKFKTFSI